MAGPSVDDLLERWEEARDRGEPVTPEHLCADCPEHLPAVRRAVRNLIDLDAMLAGPAAADGTGQVPVAAFVGVRYQPEALHRRGGQGEVFVARDEELNRAVALKRIQDRHRGDPDVRRRFLREAEINGRLEHPGIVPVYGLGRDADGQPFYAMRLVQGRSLQEAIADYHANRGGPGERAVAFRKLLGHFVAVCNAVAYAHSRGVIHRDVKPANVMLGPYGETLLIDWGMAKAVGRTPEIRQSTTEETLAPRTEPGEADTAFGAVAGTPAFMSPEQAAGRTRAVGLASDVYGLGATLYVLLTGVAPADGKAASVLEQVRAGQVAPPRAVKADVPPALDAVCRKAMAVRQADRYPTAQALAADVERWLAGEPVTAWREPVGARAWRWVRRRRKAVFAIVPLLLVAGSALVAGMARVEHERERAAAVRIRDEAIRKRAATVRALMRFLRHDPGALSLSEKELIDRFVASDGEVSAADVRALFADDLSEK